MKKIRTWFGEEVMWLAFKIMPDYCNEKKAFAEFIIRYAKFFKKVDN